MPCIARRRGAADAGLSPAQREAIGYMGEWYAYQWLRGRYSADVDETSWVSSNRRKAFPGPPGDDGLGFDFKVGSGKRPMSARRSRVRTPVDESEYPPSGPHQGDPAREFTQSLQQQHRGIPVLDARGRDQRRQQQAQAVHDLPFAARHLLPAVPADTVGAHSVGRPQGLPA